MANQTDKYRLLVAEPHPAIRADLCETLSVLGHAPETVGTLKQVLGRLADASWDAVLVDTDICSSGIETLLTEIATVDPALSVILIDSSPTVSTVRTALRYGAKDYLVKPFSLDELVSAIRRACSTAPLLESSHVP